MDVIRFGIVGCGRGAFAVGVARALPTEMRITAVYDIRPERAQRLASDCGAETCASFEEMLSRADVDAVVLATPDHLHAGQALTALRAGKHVLSEIPAAYSVDELRDLVAASTRGPKYMMGNEVRWFPALETAKRMADDGFWGPIFYGEAEYLHNLIRDGWARTEADGQPHWRWDPACPQTTLLGGGPHAFDTLRWLTGEQDYVEVFAYGVGRSVEEHPEPSTAVCLLKARSGAAHKVTVSYAMTRPYCLYFSVYGDRGSFEGGRIDQGETFFQSDKLLHMTGMSPLGVSYWSHPGVHVSAGHGTSELFMVREFLAAIREDRAPSLGAVEAARSIAPAICAFESIRTGQPVAVPAF